MGRPTGIRKIYTDKEREQYLQNNRTRVKSKYQTSWESIIARRLDSARRNGKLVTITESEILDQLKKQNYQCYYSGIELDLKSPRLKSPSIDRLDNSKGYEPGNVVICLFGINQAKSTMSESDFLEMCESIVNWKNRIPK